MKTKIIADSTCDLSKELVTEYDIEILPLHILLGDEEEHKDGVDISVEELFAWSNKTGLVPKTSAPALKDTIDLFAKYKDEYDHLVCFTISSTMSSSNNVMKLAAEELEMEDRVFVIDSQNLSCGIGIMVLKAAEMARNGKDGKEIEEVIKKMIPLIRVSFVIDTLEFLHRGGRCGGMTAIMGGTFKIHPKIVVEHGEMKVTKKYRGPMSKVSLHYAKDLEEDLLDADKGCIFLVDTGVSEDIMSEIEGYLSGLNHFDTIRRAKAGAVISSHAGPGTVGIMYMKQV